MKTLILLFPFLLSLSSLLAQNGGDGMKCYDDIKSKGYGLFQKQKFKEAEKTYKAAKECLTSVANAGRLFVEIDSLIELADRSDKKQRDDALEKAEAEAEKALRNAALFEQAAKDADEQRKQALAAQRTALANDYAYKASTMLRDGDRSGAFTLAAFALQFVDSSNARSRRALLDAFYFNDRPALAGTYNPLPWSYTLLGHQEGVNDLAFSPDGDRIATVSSDQTLRIWDAHSGDELAVIGVGEGDLYALAYSPSGDTLAVAGDEDNRTIRLLDARTGDTLAILPPSRKSASDHPPQSIQTDILEKSQPADPKQNLDLKRANDPKQQASNRGQNAPVPPSNPPVPASESNPGGDGAVATPTSQAHTSAVQSLAWQPGGRLLASASQDGVKIWDLAEGKLLPFPDISSVADLAFSADGNRLGVGTSVYGSSWVYIFKLSPPQTGRSPLLTKTDSVFTSEPISAFAFSPRPDVMAVGTGYGSVFMYRGDSLLQILYNDGMAVGDLAFSPSGDTLAVVTSDYYAQRTLTRIFDAQAGRLLLTLTGHTSQPTALSFSPDGKRIATAALDQTAIVSDLVAAGELESHRQEAAVADLSYSSDRRWLAILTHNNELRLRPASGNSGKHKLLLNVTAFDFSPDGNLLAFARPAGAPGAPDTLQQITLLNLSTGAVRQIPLVSVYSMPLRLLAFSGDGNRLLTVNDDQGLVFDVKTGTLATPAFTVGLNPSALAFSPDGTWAAIANYQDLSIWNIRTGALQHRLIGHTNIVTDLDFSPDSHSLASASSDYSVKIWNVRKGRENFTLAGHAASVNSVEWSPDGSMILTAAGAPFYGLTSLDSYDGYAYRMGGEDGYQTAGVDSIAAGLPAAPVATDSTSYSEWSFADTSLLLPRLSAQPSPVLRSPLEQPIAYTVSDGDNTVKVWDATTGTELLTLSGHLAGVNAAVFAPDGNRIASGGSDGRVHIWQTHLDSLLARHKSATLMPGQIEKLNLQEGLEAKKGGLARMKRLLNKPQLLAFAQYFEKKAGVSANPHWVIDEYRMAFGLYQTLEDEYGDTSHRSQVARLHVALAQKLMPYEAEGHRLGSLQHFREASRLLPHDLEVKIYHAHGLLYAGQFAEAATAYLDLVLRGEASSYNFWYQFQAFNNQKIPCADLEDMVRLLAFDNVNADVISLCSIAPPPYAKPESDLLARLDFETAAMYKTLKYLNLVNVETDEAQRQQHLQESLRLGKEWQRQRPGSKKAALALEQVYQNMARTVLYNFQMEPTAASDSTLDRALHWNDLAAGIAEPPDDLAMLEKKRMQVENEAPLSLYAHIYSQKSHLAIMRQQTAEALRLTERSLLFTRQLGKLFPHQYEYLRWSSELQTQTARLHLQSGNWLAAENAAGEVLQFDPYHPQAMRYRCHTGWLLDKPNALDCYRTLEADSLPVARAELASFRLPPQKLAEADRYFEYLAGLVQVQTEALALMTRLDVLSARSDSFYVAGNHAGALQMAQDWVAKSDSLFANDAYFEAYYGRGELAKEGKTSWLGIKASMLGNASFYVLFTEKPKQAVAFATQSLSLAPEEHWVKTNLAHGYLLSGNWKKASQVYEELRSLPDLNSPDATLGKVCLEDLKMLKDAGVWHKDVPRAAAFLLGRELNAEEQATYGKPY